MTFSTTRYSPAVSHLAYADDIIIFTKASRATLEEIVDCINHYAAVSGQMINMGKSHFFIDESRSGWARQIAETSGFQQGTLPFTYLGVPIFRGIKRSSMFLFIRDMVSKRIHTWSHRFLSFGGRLTLIKSTLGAIPLHIFQVLEPTGEALRLIESLIARFFWGSSNDSKKTHWISWDQICHPIDEGGLGIRRFKEMIAAFGMKLWWRFRDQGSLWARFMFKKYCSKASPSRVVVYRSHSPTWKRMVRASREIHRHVLWSVGEGTPEFWDDIWLHDKPIRAYCNPGAAPPRKQVKDYWCNNDWDRPRLQADLIPVGVSGEIIQKILDIPIDRTGKDVMRWALTPHGNFTTASAWELSRHRQPKSEIFGLIWNEALSPSISIFAWRLLANRVPVDSKLQWRKIHLASRCRCCQSPRIETREHLFINGEAARKIWRFFANWFPDAPTIANSASDVEYRIRFWHLNMAQAPKVHVSIIIPCIIVWCIWTERNNVIHRGTVFNPSLVMDRVNHYLQGLVLAKKLDARHWRGCSPTVIPAFSRVHRRQMMRNSVIKWEPPPTQWIKLNTDGAFLAEHAAAGGGGVIRDEHGQIIMGFSAPVTATSSWEAELKALILGLSIAKTLAERVWIEIDAKQIVDMLNGGGSGVAEHRHMLTSLRNDLRLITAKITHIPREGNKIADYLARQGCQGEHLNFDGRVAPPLVKAMAITDRDGMPNFRHDWDARPP